MLPLYSVQRTVQTDLSVQLDVPYPSPPPIDLAQEIQLCFEELSAFELVLNQYQQVGVCFEGAIALHPSNPAFAVSSSSLVMMPVAGWSLIRGLFRHPQRKIRAIVTGARQIRITAYDQQRSALRKCTTCDREYVQTTRTTAGAFPNHVIELFADGIRCIEIESDAPFVVNQFCFG